jgi:uroporphyrin-III C-methyltransferase
MTVFLVGAGPGDPGLITARGLALVRRCDAVVVDELVAPELVDEAPADAVVVHRRGLRQEEVNRLIVRLGREHATVVRLKGGDPFVFGRGGDEALALAQAGIPFEVVPGVSAASAVPAAFDIPITHRGVSAQVTLVTGSSASGDELDFAQLARTPGTLVFFMGLRHAARIAAGLVSHGKDASTPAAVISRGTLPDARLAVGTLANIAPLAEGFPSPALIVVGDVVALGAALAVAAVSPAHAA